MSRTSSGGSCFFAVITDDGEMAKALRSRSKKKGKAKSGFGDLSREMDLMEKMLENINVHSVIKHLHQQGKLRGIADELGINIDETTKELDTSAVPCSHCHTMVDVDGVSCQICDKWFHSEPECSGIDSKFKDLIENPNIWYVCDTCKDRDFSQPRECTNTKMVENKLDELLHYSHTMYNIIEDNAKMTRSVANNIGEMESKIDEVDKTVSGKKTYAESLKTKKALVIKCANENQKAVDKKKSIMEKITVPVEEVRNTKEGHLYVRFDDKSYLEKAKN